MRVCLVGQPNVGKSSLFSRLTGVGVVSSNYPGTTVDIDEGTIVKDGVNIEYVDLPGTYSLSADSPDEQVVIEFLEKDDIDAIITVIDSINPEPGLVFLMEILELGKPTMVAMNKFDLASKGCKIDIRGLEDAFHVPFIPVSSKNGDGIKNLSDAIAHGCASVSDPFRRDDDAHTRFSREHRYSVAKNIVYECFEFDVSGDGLASKISRMTIEPITGIPILIAVLVSMFVMLSYFGGLLSRGVCSAYETIVGDSLSILGHSIFGDLGEAIFNGMDTSVIAIIGLVIPYILVFYILLGVLEDSGYLPRAVALTDRCLHSVGLRGNGLIPLIVGFGCNVPAIMSARTIRSRRERRILITLICLAVPCSSQLAIITGVTGSYAGSFWAVAIYGTLLLVGVCGGVLMDRLMKGERSFMAMELPLLQMPSARNVLMKMWMRSRDFFRLAIPILILGTVLIEVAMYLDVLDTLVGPMSWLTVDILGLPAVTIMALIAGMIRREMAYGVLLALAGPLSLDKFMTIDQFIVFGIVMALFMPCIASMVSIKQEMGCKEMVGIACSCIIVSIVAGAFFNHVVL